MVPDLLAMYAGKEEELLASIRDKYGSKDELLDFLDVVLTQLLITLV